MTSNVLETPAPLQPNHLPEEFEDREEEKDALEAVISGVTENRSQNLHLSGPRGTGKTHLTHLATSDLSSKVNTCYIPGTRCNSRYKALQQLYQLVTDEKIGEGYHASDLQRRIENRIDSVPAVVVVDEVDFLLLNDGDDLLYYLSRLDTREGLCIITISANHTDLREQLGERTYSSLYPQTVNFEPYDTETVYWILVERARKSLAEQSLHREALHHIASTTSKISLALTWLKTAAQATRNIITKQLVEEVEGKAFQSYAGQLLKDFSDHHRRLFQAVQELSTERDSASVHTGEIYDRYQELSQTYNEEPLSNRRISDYLKHLELLNLIEAEYHYGGRKGKTREIAIQGMIR